MSDQLELDSSVNMGRALSAIVCTCVHVCLTTPGLYVSVRRRTEPPAKMRAKAVFKRPSQRTWQGKCWTELWVCSQANQTSHKQALEKSLYKQWFEISVLCGADEVTPVPVCTQYGAPHNRLQSWLWRPRTTNLREKKNRYLYKQWRQDQVLLNVAATMCYKKIK